MFRLLGVLLMGAALGIAGNINFTISNAVGGGSVSGTITTDGTIGVLSSTDIVDWNLLISDGTNNFDLKGPLSGNNSALDLSGTDLSETATQLLYNFSGSGFALFQNPVIGSGMNYFCMESVEGCTGSPAGESLKIVFGGDNQFTSLSGTQVVASVGGVSGVPEPSTLGLLSLGAVFLVGRRKFLHR